MIGTCSGQPIYLFIYYLLFMYGTYGIQAVTVTVEREKPSESAASHAGPGGGPSYARYVSQAEMEIHV